jgi:hypothetical protein
MPKTSFSYPLCLVRVVCVDSCAEFSPATACGRMRLKRLFCARHPIKCILTVSVFALVWVEEPLSG